MSDAEIVSEPAAVAHSYNLQAGGAYKASGRFAALPCGVRFRVATPLRLARARLKFRRRAYLAGKPRPVDPCYGGARVVEYGRAPQRNWCWCHLSTLRATGGVCGAQAKDPDGNTYCTATPF